MAEQSAKVALGLSNLSVTNLLALNTTIVDSMTANPAFPAPTIDLKELAKHGKDYSDEETSIGNDLARLKARRTANRNVLTGLKRLLGIQGDYVNSMAQGSRALIESAGMTVAAEPQPKGKMATVTGLTLAAGGSKGQVRATWDAVARRGGGSGYLVYSGPSPDQMRAKEYAHVSSFTLTNQVSGTEVWVCVQALGKESGDCCKPTMQMVP